MKERGISQQPDTFTKIKRAIQAVNIWMHKPITPGKESKFQGVWPRMCPRDPHERDKWLGKITD